jgi:hypothetical protein
MALPRLLQNSDLNANTWTSNRPGIVRPQSRDNRLGGSLGVCPRPERAKTYFYMNYEGRRLVAQQVFSRIVPPIRCVRASCVSRLAGNIAVYNLASAQLCGTQGNSACDRAPSASTRSTNCGANMNLRATIDPGRRTEYPGFTAALLLPPLPISEWFVDLPSAPSGRRGSYRMYKEFLA